MDVAEAGADLEGSRDDKKRSTIHWAALGGKVESVKFVLDKDPSCLDRPTGVSGWTPLMCAVQTQKFEVVEMLVLAGADRSLVDREGETAFAMAKKEADKRITKLVKPGKKANGAGGGSAKAMIARASSSLKNLSMPKPSFLSRLCGGTSKVAHAPHPTGPPTKAA